MLENIDQLRDGFGKVDERFSNRLSGKEIRFVENYINNRFGIVVRLHGAGEADSEWLALCIDAHAWQDLVHTAIRSDAGKPFFELNEVSDNQQELMLVDVVELVKSPDEGRFIVPSFVRSYCIKNEGLGPWEGAIYRSVLPLSSILWARFFLVSCLGKEHLAKLKIPAALPRPLQR